MATPPPSGTSGGGRSRSSTVSTASERTIRSLRASAIDESPLKHEALDLLSTLVAAPATAVRLAFPLAAGPAGRRRFAALLLGGRAGDEVAVLVVGSAVEAGARGVALPLRSEAEQLANPVASPRLPPLPPPLFAAPMAEESDDGGSELEPEPEPEPEPEHEPEVEPEAEGYFALQAVALLADVEYLSLPDGRTQQQASPSPLSGTLSRPDAAATAGALRTVHIAGRQQRLDAHGDDELLRLRFAATEYELAFKIELRKSLSLAKSKGAALLPGGGSHGWLRPYQQRAEQHLGAAPAIPPRGPGEGAWAAADGEPPAPVLPPRAKPGDFGGGGGGGYDDGWSGGQVVEMRGVLRKKGRKRQNWLERFFVLKGTHLAYYDKQSTWQQDSAKALGELSMPEYHLEFSETNECILALRSPQRVLHLEARSGDEAEDWSEALLSAIGGGLSRALQANTALSERGGGVQLDVGGKIACQGWMYKRGEKSGAAFRRRWCVLWRDQHAKGTAGSHGLLTYYDKPKDSEPKGAVVLKDCYVLVGGITEGASKTDYCELRLMFRNGRTYIWSCEKQEDSFAWARAISATIGLVVELDRWENERWDKKTDQFSHEHLMGVERGRWTSEDGKPVPPIERIELPSGDWRWQTPGWEIEPSRVHDAEAERGTGEAVEGWEYLTLWSSTAGRSRWDRSLRRRRWVRVRVKESLEAVRIVEEGNDAAYSGLGSQEQHRAEARHELHDQYLSHAANRGSDLGSESSLGSAEDDVSLELHFSVTRWTKLGWRRKQFLTLSDKRLSLKDEASAGTASEQHMYYAQIVRCGLDALDSFSVTFKDEDDATSAQKESTVWCKTSDAMRIVHHVTNRQDANARLKIYDMRDQMEGQPPASMRNYAAIIMNGLETARTSTASAGVTRLVRQKEIDAETKHATALQAAADCVVFDVNSTVGKAIISHVRWLRNRSHESLCTTVCELIEGLRDHILCNVDTLVLIHDILELGGADVHRTLRSASVVTRERAKTLKEGGSHGASSRQSHASGASGSSVAHSGLPSFDEAADGNDGFVVVSVSDDDSGGGGGGGGGRESELGPPPMDHAEAALEQLFAVSHCNSIQLKECLRRALEKAIAEPLHSRLMQEQERQSAKDDAIVNAKRTWLSDAPQERFGVPLELRSPTNFSVAVMELNEMDRMSTPHRKVATVLAAVRAIYKTLERDCSAKADGKPREISADDFLPIFTYVVAHSSVEKLQATANYMFELLGSDVMGGETGCYLCHFSGVLMMLKLEDTAEEEAAAEADRLVRMSGEQKKQLAAESWDSGRRQTAMSSALQVTVTEAAQRKEAPVVLEGGQGYGAGEDKKHTYIAYVMEIERRSAGRRSVWTIEKRFSQFEALAKCLLAEEGASKEAVGKLPSKLFNASKAKDAGSKVVQARVVELQAWLTRLVDGLGGSAELDDFLGVPTERDGERANRTSKVRFIVGEEEEASALPSPMVATPAAF